MGFDWSNLANPAWLVSTIYALLAITVIDLALSGDNAAVIGLAIKDLPEGHRKKAALLGAGGAIILRVSFTAIATYLTRVSYVNAIGGLILLWITWKLLAHQDVEEKNIRSSERFWSAVGTIIVADLSMAFDNVMGVAGAAHGNVALVIFGLTLSIPILILGSNWLAIWMNRQPFIIFVGAAVLIHTAMAMIFHDRGLNLTGYVGLTWAIVIPWLLAIPMLVWGWFEATRIKAARAREAEVGLEAQPDR
ncbi:MAG: TerC family protein [Firmicutes bacterium]|nr:TerC family protein [Bacillota bacterium]MCL5040239.1 TerC family protein [Bacillota bacterium]